MEGIKYEFKFLTIGADFKREERQANNTAKHKLLGITSLIECWTRITIPSSHGAGASVKKN